jgi:hypothetical protein
MLIVLGIDSATDGILIRLVCENQKGIRVQVSGIGGSFRGASTALAIVAYTLGAAFNRCEPDGLDAASDAFDRARFGHRVVR